MGGIAAGPDGRTTMEGLFAVGECAATGVHGANRLASNSLLEAAAFGRRTGRAAAQARAVLGPTLPPRPAADLSPADLDILRRTMSAEAGVVRDAAGLRRALTVLDRLDARTPDAPPLVAARLIVEAALARRESRGGHYRADFPAAAAEARHTRLRVPTPAMAE
jgi:L-aspartate oxidase